MAAAEVVDAVAVEATDTVVVVAVTIMATVPEVEVAEEIVGECDSYLCCTRR